MEKALRPHSPGTFHFDVTSFSELLLETTCPLPLFASQLDRCGDLMTWMLRGRGRENDEAAIAPRRFSCNILVSFTAAQRRAAGFREDACDHAIEF